MIDGDAWPILQILADCLCDQLALAEVPETCFCGVLPGAVATPEFGNGDMAWVRLVNSYPSSVFPTATQTQTCATPLAYVIEVGVLRCAVMPDSQGQTTPTQQSEAAQVQMADMRAARKAVCCLPDDYEYVIQTYAPMGPQGGIVGGAWQIVVGRA